MERRRRRRRRWGTIGAMQGLQPAIGRRAAASAAASFAEAASSCGAGGRGCIDADGKPAACGGGGLADAHLASFCACRFAAELG
jgi:hypothetical protein